MHATHPQYENVQRGHILSSSMLRNEVAQIEIMRCIQPFAHVVIAELE